MFARFKLDFLFIAIITLLTTIAWHGILNQTISGEGYYYFAPSVSFISADGKLTDILRGFDNFARVSTFILGSVFKGDIQGYMNTEFFIIAALNIFMYVTLRIITGKSTIAILSTLYFALSYTGNFQIYARGHYQWFMQRVPEFFPILASFIFVNRFLEKKRIINYIISIFFFTLAILFTHYTTLFLPFFLSIFLVDNVLKRKGLRGIFYGLLLCIPFVLINFFIVFNSRLSFDTIKPHQTLLASVLNVKEVPQKVSFQLVVATIPFNLLEYLNKITSQSYKDLVFKGIFPTYLFYFALIFYLYKNKFKSMSFVVGSFFALIGVLYLNIYLGRVTIYNEIEQGRYFYIPKLYVGIIFASALYTFLKAKKLSRAFKYLLVLSLLCFYIVPNVKYIWKKVDSSQYEYDGGRILMNYLSSKKDQIPDGSIVMLPQPLMPLGENFLKKYYRTSDVKFLFIDSKWLEKMPEGFDPNKLYVFDYKQELENNTKKAILVDKSATYRETLKQNYVSNMRK